MRKTPASVFLGMGVILVGTLSACSDCEVASEATASPEPAVQQACPMSGKPINKAYYVEHKGEKIYFCGPGCQAKARADPAMLDALLKKQAGTKSGETVVCAGCGKQECACGGFGKAVKSGKPQTACPVMGGAINKGLYVDHAGKRIYLCCAGCIAEVKKNPEKYIKAMEDKGVELEKAP